MSVVIMVLSACQGEASTLLFSDDPVSPMDSLCIGTEPLPAHSHMSAKDSFSPR